MSNREQAKKSILERIPNIDNDDVLRSICLVMGDYAVCENGQVRASYITAILLNIASVQRIDYLNNIYVFSEAVADSEAKGVQKKIKEKK